MGTGGQKSQNNGLAKGTLFFSSPRLALHTRFALCAKCSIHLAWFIKRLLPRLPAPLSTRQIALLFKDLVHYVFVASGKVFTNYFRLTAFLSSFMPTRISKVHVSWWLTKTRNFKDFLHTLYKSCFFRSWKETNPGNNFLWGQVISMFTPASHWELFISARHQTTCQTDVMNNFFLPQHYTKGIQSSADGTSQLTTFSLTFAHIASVFSRFSAHSCSQLVASLTSRQIYNTFWPWRNSLKLFFFCPGSRLSSLNYSFTV